MNSINANTILKNLTVIICGLIIVALLLPFAAFSVEASSSVYNASEEVEALSGFTFVLGGGILGYLLGLMPVIMLAASFLPQLEAYKKYICAGASILGIILLFLVPGQYHSSESVDIGVGSATVSTTTTYKLGFWVILILFIIQIAIAVVQFFNLKGNKVFDAINTDDGQTGSSPVSPINTEAIAGFTKNITDTIKGKAANFSASHAKNSPSAGAAQPQAQIPVAPPAAEQAPSTAQTYAQPTTQDIPVTPPVNMANTAQPQESPDEIMERIEKLYKMKEAGILSEDEFNAKKSELLVKM